MKIIRCAGIKKACQNYKMTLSNQNDEIIHLSLSLFTFLPMTETPRPFGKAYRKDFALEEQYTPVNHGSFGVYPNVIKPLFREYQDKAEQHPDRWNRFTMKPLIQRNLERVAELVHCDPTDLAFVLNASNGVNTVLRSYPFKQGDKIICVSLSFQVHTREKKPT